jgi:hypothetical protein
MEGAAIRASREYDHAIAQAWHTAMFGLQGYSGKLKGKRLSDFLAQKPEPKSGAAQAIAFFHKIKARGIPVSITRVPRNPE